MFFAKDVFATIIHVGKEQNIKTIRQALLLAADGDTVLVGSGQYHEQNILINKSIALIGINHPILDGDNKYEIISIKANAVTVEGFKLINSGVSSIEDFAGIKVYNGKDIVIRNNILENTFFGIYPIWYQLPY
ncbi:MAG: hypothetical protein R2765_11375 [Ferruginibacter sp.]